MRPVLVALDLAAPLLTVLASPALALTITTAPNVEQQQHLRPAPAQRGVDIRDSYLGQGGGPTGLSYGQGARSNTDAPRFYYNAYDGYGRFVGAVPADDRFDTPFDRRFSNDPNDLNRLTPRRR